MFGRNKKQGKDRKQVKPSLIESHRSFVCTMNGTRELNIENYGSLGDYSEEKIVLHCDKCQMVIEGEKLLIAYFTDIDMRITGRIRSIHF
ncbi:MAG: YabP/YqfC family sporulation protein [Clostridiales bacterium]|nr:YabP/YqfC family sporulation protein [Clostridiales bacterium]